jgi:enoyl-CoA hydratase
MDGVVMGGGVGISAPATWRVATERTTFAMPETGIGLFPDVGGGWWLSRLRGDAGLWLALTGARIKAADCRLLGLATHQVAHGDLDALKRDLLAAPSRIEDVLGAFAVDPGPAPLADRLDDIDRLFAGDSVEAIVAALEADGSDWARGELATLQTKSPQALKVSFRQLREGRAMASFADEMRSEYRIARRVCRLPDFQEGVRAVILDKDNAPRWEARTLAEVSAQRLDEIFAPLPDGEEWTPLS